jgi:hypothetical protein
MSRSEEANGKKEKKKSFWSTDGKTALPFHFSRFPTPLFSSSTHMGWTEDEDGHGLLLFIFLFPILCLFSFPLAVFADSDSPNLKSW